MGVGKYSPTVSAWYSHDQKWFKKNCLIPDAYIDKDGYDSYGYHAETGKDRAGYTEHDYMTGWEWATTYDGGVASEEPWYYLHEEIIGKWARTPVPKKE